MITDKLTISKKKYSLDLSDTTVTEEADGTIRVNMVMESFSIRLEVKQRKTKKLLPPTERGYVVNGDILTTGTGPWSITNWLRTAFSFQHNVDKWDKAGGMSESADVNWTMARCAMLRWLVE